MTIGAKLTWGFGFLVFLLIGVSVFALKQLGDSNAVMKVIGEQSQARMSLADDILSAGDRRAIAARNLLIVKDEKDLAQEKASLGTAQKNMSTAIQKLNSALSNDSDVTAESKQLFSQVSKVESAYEPLVAKIVDLASKGDSAAAAEAMTKECRPALHALEEAIDAYIGHEKKMMQANLDKANTSYNVSRNLLIIVALLATVAATVFAAYTVRGLNRSLGGEPQYATEVARRIAAGDLSTAIATRSGDKESLLAAIKLMQESLANIVADVRNSADHIASSSTEIAVGNNDLSSRTEQQASNLQQTASSMEQMTGTVKQNADAARQANQLAVTASEIATKGGSVVSQVVTTMDDITHSSKKIADIIGVIDGIAFQTNILALNAAVEAARAGEQGRGFAVVAAEVRNLAQRSAEAAKEIKSLIGSSVEKVDTGSKLVADAGQTMSEIVQSVKRVTDIIGEITAATQEQSTGINEVNQAVGQLDQMTQQNAALVEQSAAAAESLKEQAAKLAEAVSVFRLNQNSPVSRLEKSTGLKAQVAISKAMGGAVGKDVSAPKAAPPKPAATPRIAGPSAPAPKVSPKSADDDWEEF
ncbi:MAG: MCP four helix bundle domain-containing protein [Betaproteobacteria bacterium]|nr:MCP four helix bundle domain-containing protein [Betaproteobacteria bacterium]